MRLQTRLVKLNSYKPENKTENPAKERDFFILYDQNLPRNGNTPYLSTRSSSSSGKTAILVISQRRQPLTNGRTAVHILDKYLVYFKSGLY